MTFLARGIRLSSRRAGIWAAIALAPLPGAAESVELDEPILLPPFFVEESINGPPWRYAKVPGGEILSRCGDEKTREFFKAYDRLHQLLGEFLPESLRLSTTVPKALILFDESLQPVSSREVISGLMQDAPSVAPRSGPIRFGGRRMRPVAPTPRVRFVPNLRLWDRDAMSLFVIMRRGKFDGDSLALTAGYVRYLLNNRLPALPAWFIAGFQTLYARTTFGRDRLTLAPLKWSRAVAAAARGQVSRGPPVLMSLAELFSADLSPRLDVSDEDLAQLWRAQAALLVRWGIDGDRDRRRAWWNFVERSALEGASEALLHECLGLDFAAVLGQLGTYRSTAVRRSLRIRPSSLSPPPVLALRDATAAEVGRIKGDWERMEIAHVKSRWPALAGKYQEQAQRTLASAYRRDPYDAGLLAVLGLYEVDIGEDEKAREYLEAAYRLGELRPRAAYELARLRHDALRAGRPADGRLLAEEAVSVFTPLFAAREEQPPLPEVYELIGEVWAHCEAVPTRGHLRVLDEGIRLFPRRTALILRAAELNAGHGYRAAAIDLIELGCRLAPDAAARRPFEELRRRLDRGP